MIDNQELPIGFMMELAEHSDVLNYFAGLPKNQQDMLTNGARVVNSREEMRSYVENIGRAVGVNSNPSPIINTEPGNQLR